MVLLEETGLFVVAGLVVMAVTAFFAWRHGYIGDRASQATAKKSRQPQYPSSADTPYRYRIDWPDGAVGTFGSHLHSALEINAKNGDRGTIMVSADRGQTWKRWTPNEK